MPSSNIPQGKNVEYGQPSGRTGVQYGADDLAAAVELIPPVQALLTRSGGSWNASRIEGATLTSVAFAAGTITVELALEDAVGFNGTTRLAKSVQLYTPGRPCGISVLGTLSNTASDGDTLEIEIEAADVLTGAALAAVADGDQINILIANP